MISIARVPVAERAAYLAADPIIDHDDPRVRAQAARLRGSDALDSARRCFTFVRDAIEHSFDFQRSPTTCTASETLAARTGFCYAKSHLLAALLRANGIPAGLCYQRLCIDAPDPPHSLHGLVAVELPTFGWYAIDARGNKAGVDAQFSPPREQLAFRVENAGERDFSPIYPRPLAVVVDCLRTFTTWEAVVANLPDALELAPDTPQVGAAP